MAATAWQEARMCERGRVDVLGRVPLCTCVLSQAVLNKGLESPSAAS